MRRWPTLALAAALALPVAAQDKKKDQDKKQDKKKGQDKNAPELPAHHVHASGAFSFRTPIGWSLQSVGERRELLEASGDGLRVRFFFLEREVGLDSLHVQCIDMRLRGPMETNPRTIYQHDFLGGALGERRTLDSAFEVTYDTPVDGETVWRQRNVTIVGLGQSLCVSSHAPRTLQRKSATKKLLEAILASVTFRE
jgi:hypothetical protein